MATTQAYTSASSAMMGDHGSPMGADWGSDAAKQQMAIGLVMRGRLGPTQFPAVTVSSCTKIGKRKKQEDRCTVVSRVLNRDDVYFFGVFDGTVGDLAAEFVNLDLPQAILGNANFRKALATAGPAGSPAPFSRGSAAAAGSAAGGGSGSGGLSPLMGAATGKGGEGQGAGKDASSSSSSAGVPSSPGRSGAGASGGAGALPSPASLPPTAGSPAAYIRQAVEEGFLSTDDELLKICALKGADYASCTAVTAVLAGDVLTLAHLGDSKIALGREAGSAPPMALGPVSATLQNHLGAVGPGPAQASTTGGGGAGSASSAAASTTTHGAGSSMGGSSPASLPTSPIAGTMGGLAGLSINGSSGAPSSTAQWGSVTLVGRYLTEDHKPDQLPERRRIESCGGSLAYLHGGKPFIRGGDFTERQAKGDRPMQLNYSRAFGGKDLKPFGLLPVPDITQLVITKADRLLILASDGLWDVVNADTAVRRAAESLAAGRDPALDLTDFALAQHDLKGSVDNVTVTVVIFNHPTA